MKKKNSTPVPHDATFRQFLTQPDIARDFMELHLPPELRVCCDLSTLKLESGHLSRMTFGSTLATCFTVLKQPLAMDISMYSLSISLCQTNIWHFG